MDARSKFESAAANGSIAVSALIDERIDSKVRPRMAAS